MLQLVRFEKPLRHRHGHGPDLDKCKDLGSPRSWVAGGLPRGHSGPQGGGFFDVRPISVFQLEHLNGGEQLAVNALFGGLHYPRGQLTL